MSFPEANSRTVRRLIFATVLLLSALYAAKGLMRGWFPWDEGIFGQSAEAVLRGELPHRDYVEIYTGGLSYLNALSFRLFGTNLGSMRYMLFLFFLPWVPAFYYAVRRFVSAPVAGAVTLLAVAWSLPNWPAPMPSWYNLFFATFGLALLLRYIESPKPYLLLAAGLCGGISCVFKVSGLYFIAAALLFFLFRQQTVLTTKTVNAPETAIYRIFVTVSVLTYETMVFLVLRNVANSATYVYFWLPNLAIGAVILFFEFYRSDDRGHSFSLLFRELTPFAIGVFLPIGAFLIRYALAGDLLQPFRGISGSVEEHLLFVNSKPSVMKFFLGLSVNLLLGALVFLAGSRVAKAAGILFWVGTPFVLYLARTNLYVDRAVWGTIWPFLAVVVVAGTVLLGYWTTGASLDLVERQKLFLVLSVCATANLIQFPFSAASYYCHVVPFAFLAATALLSYLQSPPRWALSGALCFCFLYIALDVTPGFVPNMGQQCVPDRQISTLGLPRAGALRVDPKFRPMYDDLSTIIRKHVRGQYTFAMPSCPEVYFLNGLQDATQKLFQTPYLPSERTRVVMSALREHDVNLVVLKNNEIPFGATVPSDLRASLEQEFPNRELDGPFEVRWK
jgi:hypothetical protein